MPVVVSITPSNQSVIASVVPAASVNLVST
jgi:hypothetical protein